jgi:hypothetical protein
MSDAHLSSTARGEFPDRRKSPRTEVLGQMQTEVLSSPMSAIVREISAGGFSLETSVPPPSGVHRFRFRFEDQTPVEISAESVHSARVTLSGGTTIFVSGFEFLPSDAATQTALARLTDRIAALCIA